MMKHDFWPIKGGFIQVWEDIEKPYRSINSAKNNYKNISGKVTPLMQIF